MISKREEEESRLAQAKTLGRGDKGSRAKAEAATERNQHEADEWPVNGNGKPLIKIQMQASEIIPTGQYANVSVGPAVVTAFIDPDNDDGIPEDERENISNALNQLAELVEKDVIAVQRNLVLESLQQQLSA